VEINALQKQLQKFADERDWDQFHSVRNLVLALLGEAGELAEVLQWVSDDEINSFLEAGGRQRLSEELADVLIYLVRLADKAGVDLESAVSDKLASNGEKYPVDQARGNAKKYTEFNR
jgi:dCTP diphosphatase